jgi:hypothetical protein
MPDRPWLCLRAIPGANPVGSVPIPTMICRAAWRVRCGLRPPSMTRNSRAARPTRALRWASRTDPQSGCHAQVRACRSRDRGRRAREHSGESGCPSVHGASFWPLTHNVLAALHRRSQRICVCAFDALRAERAGTLSTTARALGLAVPPPTAHHGSYRARPSRLAHDGTRPPRR